MPTIALRPLLEPDFPAMARWLCDPRVLEWHRGRDRPMDVAQIAEHYYAPRVRGDDGFRASIIELDGRPIGYLQAFPLGRWAADYGIEDASGVWAADLFLGEPELWGRGLGTAALVLAVEDAFARRGATRFVIDPRVANGRAIRSYEKVGFRKVKVLPAHELHEGTREDGWLMEFVRLA